LTILSSTRNVICEYDTVTLTVSVHCLSAVGSILVYSEVYCTECVFNKHFTTCLFNQLTLVVFVDLLVVVRVGLATHMSLHAVNTRA